MTDLNVPTPAIVGDNPSPIGGDESPPTGNTYTIGGIPVNVPELPPQVQNVVDQGMQYRRLIWQRYRKILDDSTPHRQIRWGVTGGLFLFYFLRVYFGGGFYIVSYALGIYLLSLLVGFLTPHVDPTTKSYTELDDDDDAPTLPGGGGTDEFKPFIRRLPEFKFWHCCTRAVFLSVLATFLPFLDVPVFWPILLLYFLVLTFVTMKKQIRHMLEHKYIPFSIGKPKYGAGGGTGKMSK
eukprot:TRINITY_DN7736_c0_g1_i1.p1 TRINITY_DN7736_c0_g1~~TRINITY_DN7736_c0_g1_i1.p1  ORF type:complete len:238 (+),score=32.14 TRINITY_DN7736_c0_g1_i1:265-978(+)